MKPVTYDHKEIMRRAMTGHSIDFLKSKAVAEAVAERLKARLGRRKPPGFIKVEESLYPDTWRVCFYALVDARDEQRNEAEAKVIAEAIKAIFRPEDLVTTWTSPL